MRALRASLCVAALVATLLLLSTSVEGNQFLAFSLDEAENRLGNASNESSEVRELGRITHLMGVVYDQQRDDLILVGELVEGAPGIGLDDFVVCLRAEILAGSPPIVSIDLSSDTRATGMQIVRFEGGIEKSQFGMELLIADVLLKKMGLDMLQDATSAVPSYFSLSLNDYRDTGRTEDIVTKIWFTPARESFTATRGGVSVVKELVIDARTESTQANPLASDAKRAQDAQPGEGLGKRFAEAVASEFRNLCNTYAEFARLDQLFRPAALARSVREMKEKDASFQPRLDYWLKQYDVHKMETPERYPVLERAEFVRREGQAIRMTMQGGIELDAIVADLNAGDAEAFKKAVLTSRPDGQSLTWPVALDNWQLRALPGMEDDTAKAAADRVRHAFRDKLSCSFLKTFEPANSRDRVQVRLDTVKAGLQRQIQQPHALDLVRQLQSPTRQTYQPLLSQIQRSQTPATTSRPVDALATNMPRTQTSGPSRLSSTLAVMNAMSTSAAMASGPERHNAAFTTTPMAPHVVAALLASSGSQSPALRTLQQFTQPALRVGSIGQSRGLAVPSAGGLSSSSYGRVSRTGVGRIAIPKPNLNITLRSLSGARVGSVPGGSRSTGNIGSSIPRATPRMPSMARPSPMRFP